VSVCLSRADIIYICVNTPPLKKKHLNYLGKPTDMGSFHKVVKAVYESNRGLAEGHKIIIEKSTVPVGTHQEIKDILHRLY